MLLQLMNGLGMFYYWTWFIWPFFLVFGLYSALSSLILEKKESGGMVLLAAVSLLVILAGITSPNFM